MQRLAIWLCLFIAVAGPLASQARVAYGLLLSRSEVGSNVLESGQEIEDEDYDGRDLVTIVAHPDAGLDCQVDLSLPMTHLAIVPAPIASSCAAHDAGNRPGRWKWPPPTALERCALLQTRLI